MIEGQEDKMMRPQKTKFHFANVGAGRPVTVDAGTAEEALAELNKMNMENKPLAPAPKAEEPKAELPKQE